MTSSTTNENAAKVVLAIHGGLAGPRENMNAERERGVRTALEEALKAGFDVLRAQTGDCVGAVIAAVQVMEDSPHFNAGLGSVFTQGGTIEMDAAIMQGKDRQAGVVASVKRIRNPILAAQAVMTRSPAVFLVGSEADEFAAGAGLEIVDPSYFIIDRRRDEFLAWKERRGAELSRGTVGAAALDRNGDLAAATSTGGVSFKVRGRVGDSGVLGAGTHADNRSCAVSCTGDGELFIRSSAAYSVSARMRYGNLGVAESAQAAVDDIRSLGGNGGLIALDRQGHLALPYHAAGMFRGSVDDHGNICVALYKD